VDNFEVAAKELCKIAYLVKGYGVKDEQAKEKIIAVFGRNGLIKWNALGTLLVDFSYAQRDTFSNKVCMAAHNIGSRMTNFGGRITIDELWKYIIKGESIVTRAGLNATSLFNLDYMNNKTAYGLLKNHIYEARLMAVKLKRA